MSEKLGELKGQLDDPAFPRVCYRRGAAGRPTPVVRGTGIRVQTLHIAAETWAMTVNEIAEQYDLKPAQVEEALSFCRAHRAEIDALIAADEYTQNDETEGTVEAAAAP